MANIVTINNLDLPELAIFAGLTNHQLRNKLEPEKGIFIAEGGSVINLALENGYEPIALLMEKKRLDGPAAGIIAKCGAVPVYVGDREILAGLTGYKLTRGILGAFRRKALPTVEKICQGARRLAVLDGITDSVNVGAIFRSAAALNMDGILVRKTCCDPLCRRSIRVSMGTIFQVPWAVMDEDVSDLSKLGFKTAAMALSTNSISIADEKLREEKKLALVFGSEGYGLPQEIISSCDYIVKIPMSHNVDSLNVAAASAVAFWQLGRK